MLLKHINNNTYMFQQKILGSTTVFNITTTTTTTNKNNNHKSVHWDHVTLKTEVMDAEKSAFPSHKYISF